MKGQGVAVLAPGVITGGNFTRFHRSPRLCFTFSCMLISCYAKRRSPPAMAITSSRAPAFKPKNKIRRQDKYHEILKTKGKNERDRNHSRKREEARNPRLRDERLANNIPATIDKKRIFDDVDNEEGDGIGLSIDVERLKRRKTDAEELAKTQAGGLTETNLKKVEALKGGESDEEGNSDAPSADDDLGSLMDSDGSELDTGKDTDLMPPPPKPKSNARAASPPASTTSTNLTHIPDALAQRFPSLFHPAAVPKILITTTIDATVHQEAELLTGLFPNCNYVRRTEHRYRSYRPSIREICKGAQKRGYTAVMILGEDKKRPSSLQIVHLPQSKEKSESQGNPASAEDPAVETSTDAIADTSTPAPTDTPQQQQTYGPTFTFSIKNFLPPSRIPGHGNPTPHHPELLLNNFRTPLGLLVATLFRSLFPSAPEISGRNVVTFHDQRDYIFVRRHRYIFRERRETEKKVVGSDGKEVKGVEGIRTGLQELGPRFTMKLRRVDEGVGRGSKRVWEWKAGDEKVRTRFAL